MKARGWLVWLVLLAVPAAGWGAPPLPEWEEADLELLDSESLVPGSVLFGEALIDPATGVAEEVAAVAVPAPEPGEEVSDGAESGAEVPEEFLAEYFERRPESLLVDPQRLLSQQEYRDRLEFLRYHARESAIDLVVYLFGAEQEIPGEVRAEELVERLFSAGRPSAVVLYYLGAPQRSQVLASPQLAEVVSTAERRRALAAAVTEALEKSDAVDQLDGFTVQLSIWLYRMEKALGGGPPAGEPLVVFPECVAEEESAGWFEQVQGMVRVWWPSAVAGAGGVLVAGLVWWLVVRRLRYRFPVLAVAPRLGGAQAAGIGAVLSFASTAMPPSVQREQMPDYLQRL